jgi:hypothetical protein
MQISLVALKSVMSFIELTIIWYIFSFDVRRMAQLEGQMHLISSL